MKVQHNQVIMGSKVKLPYVGKLIYYLCTKISNQYSSHLGVLSSLIASRKLDKEIKIDFSLDFVKKHHKDNDKQIEIRSLMCYVNSSYDTANLSDISLKTFEALNKNQMISKFTLLSSHYKKVS
jgi:hypothetical protein